MQTVSLASIPPAFILLIGGVLIALLPLFLGRLLAILLPFAALMAIWSIPQQAGFSGDAFSIAGFGAELLHVHPYTHIFATAFAIALAAGMLFCGQQGRKPELAAATIYAGSAIGVTFAGDFLALFLYWELMAIASTFVLLAGHMQETRRAALRYALMHITGGMLLMLGIIAQAHLSGSLLLTPLTADTATWHALLAFKPEGIAPWLILAGVLVNAAAPPFSAWLADAYPEASVSGMVFLSAFTTKAAVFVLITLFAGNAVLIWLGLYMVFYGIIYAILENDMRRILAYSIVNQVGFMVIGAGIGTTLALHGAAAHAFCHIIYKALLLMSAGAVLYRTGKRKRTELGGLYRAMPWTMVCGVIGALSISAFPWTSGFTSKSMIAEASAHEHLAAVWFLLAAGSAGVFLHAGIKFPWFVFFNRESGLKPREAPFSMCVAMGIMALLCLVFGMFPSLLYRMLPGLPDYRPYTFEHVVAQLQLLLFSGLAFFALLPLLKRTNTITLDLDWSYRVFLYNIVLLGNRLLDTVHTLISRLSAKSTVFLLSATLRVGNPQGILARPLSIGITALGILILLAISLVLYYGKL